MKYFVSALILGLFAALSAAAPTPDLPDPNQVTIHGVNYAGRGCEAGTLSVSHSQDWQTFTILFDKYEASIGPGSRFSDRIKGCNLNFQVHCPPGYQYTLYKNDFIGYALIELGVALTQTSSYWFAGFIGDKPTFQSTWPGPYNSQYTLTDTLHSTAWSPCGASTTLNINTHMVLTSSNPKSQALINISSIESKIEYQHVYGVNWRRCN